MTSAGPLIALLGFLILPFVWSVPEALVTAELATAFPEDSGCAPLDLTAGLLISSASCQHTRQAMSCACVHACSSTQRHALRTVAAIAHARSCSAGRMQQLICWPNATISTKVLHHSNFAPLPVYLNFGFLTYVHLSPERRAV